MVNVLYYISRVRKREKHKENGRRERCQSSRYDAAQNPKGVRVPRHETIKKKYLHARNVTYSFVYPSILHPGVSQCSPCCLIVYVEASLGNSLLEGDDFFFSSRKRVGKGERDEENRDQQLWDFYEIHRLLVVV